MLVYRITFRTFTSSLFAPGIEGRWNGAARKVIYAAESIPLAFMENMIRRKGVGFNDDFRIMIIEIPDSLGITVITPHDLADGWRDYRDYTICQAVGNNWYDGGKTAVLKVPSAVLPEANNYVINSAHPDFKKMILISSIPLIPDERIEDILKKYRP
jgi:RES domain-containing protein